MSKSKTALESGLIMWLQDLIGRDALLERIQTPSQSDEGRKASFCDAASRASDERDCRVLQHLDFLKIVPLDRWSLTGVDVAFQPDIVCFNPESRTLVVFKLIGTGVDMTAVAELGGNEHGLRALFPFLGHLDLCFVIVAQQWSASLLNAVSSMCVGAGRDCLLLQYTTVESSFTLDLYRSYVPPIFCNAHLAPATFRAIDLYLAEVAPDRAGDVGSRRSQNMSGERSPPAAVLAAMDMIVRSADRAGSHGFVMLWRDVHEVGCGKWCLTICVIDPYAMQVECRESESGRRASDLRAILSEHEREIEGLVRSTIYGIARKGLPFLLDRYLPEFSTTDCSWLDKQAELRGRAVPARFDFWGALGQHAREFVCDPVVREAFMSLAPDELHWSNGALAIPMLDTLIKGAALSFEGIKCADAFRVGRALGDLYIAVSTAERGVNAEAILEWSRLEVMGYALEMKLMCGPIDGANIPMPAVSDVPTESLQSIERWVTWVSANFISERHPFHRECFEIGFKGAQLFGNPSDVNLGPALRGRPDDVASRISRLLEEVIRFDETAAEPLRRFVRSVRLLDHCPTHDRQCETLYRDFPGAIVEEIDQVIPILRKTASSSEAVRSHGTCSVFTD